MNLMETDVLGREKIRSTCWMFNPRTVGAPRILDPVSSLERMLEELTKLKAPQRGQVVFRGIQQPEMIPVSFHRCSHDNHTWIEFANLSEFKTILKNCAHYEQSNIYKVVLYDVGFYIK